MSEGVFSEASPSEGVFVGTMERTEAEIVMLAVIARSLPIGIQQQRLAQRHIVRRCQQQRMLQLNTTSVKYFKTRLLTPVHSISVSFISKADHAKGFEAALRK